MKATVAGLAAILGLVSLTPSTQACTWCYACSPALHVPLGRAPSPCGMPGFYTWYPGPTCYGTTFGPNYYLRPPFAPFNGILPGQMGRNIQGGMTYPAAGMMPGPGGMGGGMGGMNIPNMPMLPGHVATPYGGPPYPQAITPVFPTHPHVRGPRDFFMWREGMEERMLREGRPNLIP